MQLNKNFTGFVSLYDTSRPICPDKVIEIVEGYLIKKDYIVVDLGCGTGLSTEIWKGYASKIIGIEPDEEMLRIAENKNSDGSIKYIKATGTTTTLEDHSVDVVICSQSFHWMAPVSTLEEVNRILTPNGIFLVIDYDWPPVVNWKAELAFEELVKQLEEMKKRKLFLDVPIGFYNKNKHLLHMKQSRYFSYCREIVIDNIENCDANRFITMALTQSSTQVLLKNYYQEANVFIERFEGVIKKEFDNQVLQARIGYRIRVGIKK